MNSKYVQNLYSLFTKILFDLKFYKRQSLLWSCDITLYVWRMMALFIMSPNLYSFFTKIRFDPKFYKHQSLLWSYDVTLYVWRMMALFIMSPTHSSFWKKCQFFKEKQIVRIKWITTWLYDCFLFFEKQIS